MAGCGRPPRPASSSGVSQLNTALASIGTLNAEIVSQKAQGLSVADLQNQRAQAENTISQLVSTRFLDQPNGSAIVLTAGGVQLPTDGSQTLSVTAATTGPTVYYPGGGIGGIMLGGTDVTGQLTGGSIGANLTLRDQTMPRYQAGLDEFAQTMSSRFAAQGLSLFTDAAGSVPVSTGPAVQDGYVGYASSIQVNPAVLATPSLVRDGTQAVAGSPTGASAFTPNATGLAGFATLISRVLTYALGPDAQDGVAQPAANSAGLGPAGNLQSGLPRSGHPRRCGQRAGGLAGGRQRAGKQQRQRRAGGADLAAGQAHQSHRRGHGCRARADGGAAERLRCERQDHHHDPDALPGCTQHGDDMIGVSLGNDIGTLSLALYNAAQTSQTIGTLSAQGSSGYLSNDYAGLGTPRPAPRWT